MKPGPVSVLQRSARRVWHRSVGCWALLVVMVLLGVFTPRDASAYAWMIRHGYAKCSTCHSDPSGGEILTHMGRVQSQQLMNFNWEEGPPKHTNQSKLLFGQDEPAWGRFGGSLRGAGLYNSEAEDSFRAFPMQADIYGAADFGWLRAGASLGASSTEVVSAHTKAAQLTNTEEGTQLVSRSHWLGVDFGDAALLRAGRINLPFGLRTPEHTLWTRDATKTDRESDQQHGVALAYWKGALRGEWMMSLGNFQIAPDKFRERGYAGYLEYMLGPALALGVSSMILQSKAGPHFDPKGTKWVRSAHGVFGRYAPLDSLVVMGEADVLQRSESKLGITGFVQADWEPLQGLHGMLTVEVLDNGRLEGGPTYAGYGELQTGYWATLNWFFYHHLDVRLDAIFRQDQPMQILTQLHLYF